MKITLLLVGMLTLLASCSSVSSDSVQESNVASSEPAAESSSSSYSYSQPAKNKGEMFLYSDPVLGFSIELPKRVSFNPPLPSVDVGVFPDHAHQRVFIALKQWDAGYEGNSIQETTLKLLQNSDNPRGPRTWELVSKTIRNDTELESFIKERYGKDCVSGQKAMTAQEGTFDVKISGFTPFDDPDGDCVVNYATVIRYSPSRQQVISWHMGQDVSFVSGKYPNWYVYDDDVVKSFRFLKK